MSMPQRHNHYFLALKRLQEGKPKLVAKGERITKDAVSIEAGRTKGSIKKGRASFSELILAIDAAASRQAPAKVVLGSGREVFDAALCRELSLLLEIFELKRRIAQLTGENVLPLRRTASPQPGKNDGQ